MLTRTRARRTLSLSLTALALGATSMSIAACGDSDDPTATEASENATSSIPDGTTAESSPKARPTKRQMQDQAPGKGAQTAREKATEPDSGSQEFVERTSTPGNNDQQVASDAVINMYKAFAAADAKGVCAELSEAAKKSAGRGAGSCEQSFSRALAGLRGAGVLDASSKVKVGAVDVRGDVATVTISIAGRSGKLRLIREGDSWKVENTGIPGATPGNQG